MAKYLGRTSKIQIEEPDASATYVDIAQAVSIEGPTSENREVEVTTLDSTAREYLASLPDNGTVTMPIVFDPDDTTHQLLIALGISGAVRTWRIVLPNAGQSRADFDAFVLNFPMNITQEEAITNQTVLRVSGAVTWTW